MDWPLFFSEFLGIFLESDRDGAVFGFLLSWAGFFTGGYMTPLYVFFCDSARMIRSGTWSWKRVEGQSLLKFARAQCIDCLFSEFHCSRVWDILISLRTLRFQKIYSPVSFLIFRGSFPGFVFEPGKYSRETLKTKDFETARALHQVLETSEVIDKLSTCIEV